MKPGSVLLDAVNSNQRSPYWWAFLLGLLQAQWTYTGFDASAHMAEETQDPRRRAPWGIVLSVAVSGVVGYLLLISLTLAIRDIPSALSATDSSGNPIPAAIAIMQHALGPQAGAAMGALASIAMWFCGLSCIASASRALYSLARDGGAPFSHTLRRVNPTHSTPGPAIWTIVILSLAAMLWTGAIPVVTSLSTVALYAAYIIPIALSFLARRGAGSQPAPSRLIGTPAPPPWNLGRFSRLCNFIAITYTVIICIVLVMPPNTLAGFTFLGLLAALTLLWFAWAKRTFKAPAWSTANK